MIVTPSSGNVFADLGLPNADVLLARADQAIREGVMFRPFQATADRADPAMCWVVGCPNLATVEDWAGWRWCDHHKDSRSGEGGYTPLGDV